MYNCSAKFISFLNLKMRKWKNQTKPIRVPEKYINEVIKYADFLDQQESPRNTQKKNLYLFNLKIKIKDNEPYISLRDLAKIFNLFPIEVYRLFK